MEFMGGVFVERFEWGGFMGGMWELWWNGKIVGEWLRVVVGEPLETKPLT